MNDLLGVNSHEVKANQKLGTPGPLSLASPDISDWELNLLEKMEHESTA
jgi:hypothetical protein